MLRRFAILMLKWRDFFLSFAYGLALPVRYRSSWLLRGRPMIIRRKGSVIEIGERFTACSQAKYNSLGVFQRVFIRTCERNSSIVIGHDVGMSGCVISAHTSVKIGDHVLIGSGALITDSDAHSLDWSKRRAGVGGTSASVIIEDDVFIGARAIILKGVTIGRGTIVGAGAVVSRDAPPFSVLAGNPARVVKMLRHGVSECE